MAYQQPPPPGNQQQQQQVVVVNNQPSSSRGPAQPQNQRDWSTNICGCFEDCCSCKLAFIFIIVITIYYFSTILILCFDFRRPSLFVMYCVIVSVFTDFTLQQAEWLTLDCPWCWCPRGWPSSVLDAGVLVADPRVSLMLVSSYCPWCWCPRGWPSIVLDAGVLVADPRVSLMLMSSSWK